MSDGPHRSLPMRPGWKKVAEQADNSAFEAQQVADVLVQTLEQDFRKEVPAPLLTSLRRRFGDRQGDLFLDEKEHGHGDSRRLAAGFPLSGLLINYAENALREGKSGQEGFLDATKNALSEWGQRHARQVEEHYIRESDSSRASTVRARMEEGMELVSLEEVARRVVRIDSSPSPRPEKRKGLDDGVGL